MFNSSKYLTVNIYGLSIDYIAWIFRQIWKSQFQLTSNTDCKFSFMD